ncbi:peptide deformylase [Patescibacteria group bacterium]|nr:peptide deformylase [Patescibacteria group bacterium]
MSLTKDDIITLPNPHLRQKSLRVAYITEEIKRVVQDMIDATLSWDASRNHEVGVALAAVQIDQLYQIIVVRNDLEHKEDQTFMVFINPVITKKEGELSKDYEGCLSVPDIYGKVKRYTKVRVKALDLNGQTIRLTAEGFLARIFQHEIDHLNGLMFIDHIKDDPNAFYHLDEDGKLTKLAYESVKTDPILWE